VIGLEGSVSYRPGTESTAVIGNFEQDYETKFVPLTGSLLLFIPVEGFSPYGLAGVGAYYTFYADEPPTEDWDPTFNFGYHLGFGVELPFTENVALNLDYRYIFLTPEAGDDAPEDADFSGNVFTGSLMFYF
jgi:opacity protein-like surface antigen